MNLSCIETLTPLYLGDETAWLEQMAALIAEGRFADLDYANLGEFLTDMARRDKREVMSRLTLLMIHRLEWEHQPEKRSRSLQATIAEQRRELEDALESGTLRRYAQESLAKAHGGAIEQAAIETGLDGSAFPSESDRILEQWVSKID